MNRALIFLSSATFMVAVAAAPGCTGDDDDDDGLGLSDGTYAVSNADVTDGCGFGTDSYYAGETQVIVTVEGSTVGVYGFPDDLEYLVSGTMMTDTQLSGVTVFDFTDDTSADYPLQAGDGEYDCVVDFEEAYGGTITGGGSFTLTDTISLTVTSGGGCTPAVVSSAFVATIVTALPCTTVDEVDLAH